MARNSGDLALWRRATLDRGAERLLRFGNVRRVPRKQQLTFDVMQQRTTQLFPGLRDGSNSLLQRFKSFLWPSDLSQPGGQKGHHPCRRRRSASMESSEAPAHLGDPLFVVPLGNQSAALQLVTHGENARIPLLR